MYMYKHKHRQTINAHVHNDVQSLLDIMTTSTPNQHAIGQYSRHAFLRAGGTWMLPITQPNLWYSSQVASPEVGPSCDLQVYITSNYPYDHK